MRISSTCARAMPAISMASMISEIQRWRAVLWIKRIEDLVPFGILLTRRLGASVTELTVTDRCRRPGGDSRTVRFKMQTRESFIFNGRPAAFIELRPEALWHQRLFALGPAVAPRAGHAGRSAVAGLGTSQGTWGALHTQPASSHSMHFIGVTPVPMGH
jgi:hypothetical protein